MIYVRVIFSLRQAMALLTNEQPKDIDNEMLDTILSVGVAGVWSDQSLISEADWKTIERI